jgi:hypothetical protein
VTTASNNELASGTATAGEMSDRFHQGATGFSMAITDQITPIAFFFFIVCTAQTGIFRNSDPAIIYFLKCLLNGRFTAK